VWHYWEYCLLKANHEPKKIVWNKKEMIVEAGSFITGRKEASKETGLSQQNIRSATKTLINLKMIEKSTTKSTSKFTYLSLCNYNRYKEWNVEGNHQSNQQLTSSQPASNQQLTTNNNYKELIRTNKKVSMPAEFSIFTFLCDEYQKTFARDPFPPFAYQDPDNLKSIEKEFQCLGVYEPSVLIDEMLTVTKRNRDKDANWTPNSISYFLPGWKKLPKPQAPTKMWKPEKPWTDEDEAKAEKGRLHVKEWGRILREEGKVPAQAFAEKHREETE
jgi:hypothetical protein